MRISVHIFTGSVIFLTFGCTSVHAPRLSQGYVPVEDGLRLYYQMVGEGTDTVVVPAGMYLSPELERLAQGRTIIFYDMRNRGRSDAVSDGSRLGMNYELSDLEAMRCHFGLKRMSLVGWSYLGAMVVLYATEHPEHVDRVIQIGPIPPRREPYWKQFQETIARRRSSGDRARLEELLRESSEFPDPAAHSREYHEIAHKAIVCDPTMNLRFRDDYYSLANEMPQNVWSVHLPRIIESLGSWDWRAALRDLSVPVLTIHGECDPIPLDSAREWATLMPDGRLLVVPGAGHFPWLEQPEVFYSALDRFLDAEP